MKKIIIFSLFIGFIACKTDTKMNIKNFRTGTFEIPSDGKTDRTVFTRNDTLQIEKYGNRIDSLEIYWKNNFQYTLRMLNPKTDLDNELINVKITGIKTNSYTFEAVIGHSNYVQNGTVNKISE